MLRKLMGVFTILILIGVLITGLLSMEIAKNYYYDSVKDKLVSSVKLLQRDLTNKLQNNTLTDFERICDEYSSITGERITIISKDGTVLGDSELDARYMENHSDRPEIQEALDEGIGISTRWSNSLQEEMLYVAVPLNTDREVLGVIRVSLLLNNIREIQYSIWRYIFLAIFAGISVAMVLGYRYLAGVTRPIKEITEAASTIAMGNFDKRVHVDSGDEIGKLGRTFNYMAEKLDNTIRELRDDKSKIEAILTSSINGVIAVDNERRTLIINPVAEELLDIREKETAGKELFKIARNREAVDALQRVLSLQDSTPIEFSLSWPEEKIIRAFSVPIKLKGKYSRVIGHLIVTQDITDIRKLEKIRSDFVANVTHELRTPLTSIRGFIETLKAGAIEDVDRRNRFLEIIDLEAERLERLINDILLLSEIENKTYSPPSGQVDVERVINQEIISMFTKQAQEKNIALKTYFEEDLPPLVMNMDRFKQMLINLVDNAIKYTPEGGEVLISAYTSGGNMVLKVRDTGVGIPEEHQDRIFERFYRVDKGRSRKMGGTGLGLAIVKHIVLSVGGTIKLSSKPGIGTEFKIEIPIKKEG